MRPLAPDSGGASRIHSYVSPNSERYGLLRTAHGMAGSRITDSAGSPQHWGAEGRTLVTPGPCQTAYDPARKSGR